MAELFSDGYESNDFSAFDDNAVDGNGTQATTAVVKTAGSYSGGYYVHTTGDYSRSRVALSSAQGDGDSFHLGFTLYVNGTDSPTDIFSPGWVNGNIALIPELDDGSGTKTVSIRLIDDSGPCLGVRIYGIPFSYYDDTVLALRTWHEVDLFMRLGDVGWYQLWLNRVKILEASSIDTYAGVDASRLVVGIPATSGAPDRKSVV